MTNEKCWWIVESWYNADDYGNHEYWAHDDQHLFCKEDALPLKDLAKDDNGTMIYQLTPNGREIRREDLVELILQAGKALARRKRKEKKKKR